MCPLQPKRRKVWRGTETPIACLRESFEGAGKANVLSKVVCGIVITFLGYIADVVCVCASARARACVKVRKAKVVPLKSQNEVLG